MTSILVSFIFVIATAMLIFRTRTGILNPALVVSVSWLPALAFTMAPMTATLSMYAYLSNSPSEYAFALLSLALFCVAVGAYTASKADLPRSLKNLKQIASQGDWVIPAAYAIGLSTFAYAYWNSGLLSALCGTPTDIAAGQQKLHIPHFSLLVILMDLSAIAIAARMLMTGKIWLIIPATLPVFLYLLTLQKSRVLFIILCITFVALIFQKEARQMFFSSLQKIVLFILVGISLVFAMYATNIIRGVGVMDPHSAGTICKDPLSEVIATLPTVGTSAPPVVSSESPVAAPAQLPPPLTYPSIEPPAPAQAQAAAPGGSIFATKSRALEQVFIYVGAPAIRNFSATIHGLVFSDAPTYGRLALRTLLWPFVERSTLNPTRHLGGINNGTALIFYWHDFGIVGVAVFSALAGMLAQTAFRLARQRSLFGILVGAIAFNACVMSVFTDMFFEPLTLVQVSFAAVLHFLSYSLTRSSIFHRWLANKDRSSAKAVQ